MENSGISWTNHTFNPWMGCTKVSPACKNCYAERDMDHRYGKVAWGPNGTRVLTSDANWRKPLKWNRDAECLHSFDCNAGEHSDACPQVSRPRVFCASLADVFEDWQGSILNHKGEQLFRHGSQCSWTPQSVSLPSGELRCGSCGGWSNPVTMDDVRQRLFELIDATPNLDWLLLTKRPENILRMWPMDELDRQEIAFYPEDTNEIMRRPNVWLGTSVENQEYAERRIPELLKCRDLVPVLFLSCEPLVGPLDLRPKAPDAYAMLGKYYGKNGFDPTGSQPSPDRVLNCFPDIDWVITGGESGPGARPCDPDWFRSLRDQCEAADTPFHFKQWGEFDETQTRVGVKNAGRLLDGVTHDAFPEVSVAK